MFPLILDGSLTARIKLSNCEPDVHGDVVHLTVISVPNSIFVFMMFGYVSVGSHLTGDPLCVVCDASVNARRVFLPAPIAPTDQTHQCHPAVPGTHQRTTRIPLKTERQRLIIHTIFHKKSRQKNSHKTLCCKGLSSGNIWLTVVTL